MAKQSTRNNKNTRTSNTRRGRGSSSCKYDKEPIQSKFNEKTATNDPSWYGSDASLLRDSASIPFSWAVGTPIDLHNKALEMLPSGQEFTIPGVCAIRVMPSCGRADNASDPVNTAAFSAYTFVRHQNSGHANYDAPDLMLYLLAMTQVYAYINFLQRAYGLASTYAQKNRYFPDHLISINGIDPADLRAHLADFRYGVNMLINKAASLCVPATMPIFARHAHLYQNIYIEGLSIKDQVYMYVPGGFWKYTLNPDDQSGMLQMEVWDKTAATVDELISYGNDMLARLIRSEDMNIMSGDIRKAYGDDKLIKLTPLNVDFPIVPLPDNAVLQQIKNATVVPNLNGLTVKQSSTHGYLLHQPKSSLGFSEDTYSARAQTYIYQTYLEDRMISVLDPEPTPELVMEATRSASIGRNFNRHPGGLTAEFDVYTGSDVAWIASYYYVKVANGVPSLECVNLSYCEPVDAGDPDSIATAMKKQAIISNFKFHPAHHFITYKVGDTAPAFKLTDSRVVFDVDNYAVLSDATLSKMHEAAMLSMLNVPSVIKL